MCDERILLFNKEFHSRYLQTQKWCLFKLRDIKKDYAEMKVQVRKYLDLRNQL
jgi:hypothetical protein